MNHPLVPKLKKWILNIALVVSTYVVYRTLGFAFLDRYLSSEAEIFALAATILSVYFYATRKQG